MSIFRDAVFPLVGRLLLSVIFATSAISKMFSWSVNVDYVHSKGLPMVTLLLAAALVIELLGSLSLITGYFSRTASLVMLFYLIVVTTFLHRFMSTDFQKNLGIMGGLLLLAACGPGTLALGNRQGSR